MRIVSEFQRRLALNPRRGPRRPGLRRTAASAALLLMLLSLAAVTLPPRRDSTPIHLLILTLLLGG